MTPADPINVICVYRPGNGFTDEYVYRLRSGVAQYLPVEHRFVCVTNEDLQDIETVPFTRKWPHWWSKLEIFPVFTTGVTLYLDLDVIITGDLRMILFRAKHDPRSTFWAPEEIISSDPTNFFNSSVMCWRGDHSYLYQIFDEQMKMNDRYWRQWERGQLDRWGDQGFIRAHLTEKPGMLGNLVRSYKHHGEADKKEAVVVYFHGSPRPHEVDWKPW